jgi:hypothetical protein
VSDDALPGVRWLAAKLVPSAADVPLPVLASSRLRAGDAVTHDYLRASPGSAFESRSRKFRWLPSALMPRLMAWAGYDGLLYFSGGRIIGHVFFQMRRGALHGFSTAVDAEMEGAGFSVVFLLDFVAHAARLPGIRAARVGTGGNNTTRRLLARIKAQEGELGWRVNEDGWVTFRE